MKKQSYEPQPFTLQEGYFSDKSYDSYETMSQSINNWKQLCPYQLRPNAINGRHQVLQLHSMQIVYAERKGGTMHNAGSAENSLSIGLVESCADKACFGRIKVKAGDILFFDDSHPHNFITKGNIKFILVSIKKNELGPKWSMFSKVLDHRIHDTDALLASTLHETWTRFTHDVQVKRDTQSYQDAEKEILTVILGLLAEQTPSIPKLTSGEKIALTIRDKVFYHMDGKISIHSLAKEYQVSEQTLQNSFKSLFGFTPNYFLRLLKLNIVHQELQKNDTSTTVSKIARKWGFTHMGRFSAYYTELFGENPSQTLKISQTEKKFDPEKCVDRQEEMY